MAAAEAIAKRKARQAARGAISAQEVYDIETFKVRTGLGDWALRQARRSGLRICRTSGRAFIRGADWLEFLAQQSAATDRA